MVVGYSPFYYTVSPWVTLLCNCMLISNVTRSDKKGLIAFPISQVCVPITLYRIYPICAAPSNCAALRYYSKGFILVSGNNVNFTAPLNGTAPYFCKPLLLVLPYLKYSYPSPCRQEIVLVSLDGQETIKILDII